VGIRTLAGVLALLAASMTRAEELNRKWLDADLEVARVWGRNLGPPGDATPAEYTRRLGAVGEPEVRQLGFGARTIELARPGGYLNFRFTLLVHRERIIQWRAWVWPDSSEAWAKLRGGLPAAWGGLGRDVEQDRTGGTYGYEYTWSDERGLGILHAAFEAALGRPDATAPVSGNLAPALELLTSPFSKTEVGIRCFEDGRQPSGRTAIEKIVAAGRNDLLRVVARGLNPEGRVYAARALLHLPASMRQPADRALIEALRASAVPTSTCSGCKGDRQPASALLKR
jgi:hypothetical protein